MSSSRMQSYHTDFQAESLEVRHIHHHQIWSQEFRCLISRNNKQEILSNNQTVNRPSNVLCMLITS